MLVPHVTAGVDGVGIDENRIERRLGQIGRVIADRPEGPTNVP